MIDSTTVHNWTITSIKSISGASNRHGILHRDWEASYQPAEGHHGFGTAIRPGSQLLKTWIHEHVVDRLQHRLGVIVSIDRLAHSQAFILSCTLYSIVCTLLSPHLSVQMDHRFKYNKLLLVLYLVDLIQTSQAEKTETLLAAA